jgi:hypothetical protein
MVEEMAEEAVTDDAAANAMEAAGEAADAAAEAADAAAEAAADAADAMNQETFFAVRDVALRSRPSGDSARYEYLISRGSTFTGERVPSIVDPQYYWLRITEGDYAGWYVSLTNLDSSARPDLNTSRAGYWYLSEDTTARQAPTSNADFKQAHEWQVRAGTRVEVSGTIGGGFFGTTWAEIMLDRHAGVGYVPFDKLRRY